MVFPIEGFLTFLELSDHSGENVLKYLCDDCKVDFSKCRGRSHDNAAKMAGRYNGMQKKILEKMSMLYIYIYIYIYLLFWKFTISCWPCCS
jgi:hypothetical protein